MAIETWGAATTAGRQRRARPLPSTTRHYNPALTGREGLTSMQLDLQALGLDPHRPPESTAQLRKLVEKRWPPTHHSDARPAGWGWEQQQAYSRLFCHLLQQHPPGPRQ